MPRQETLTNEQLIREEYRGIRPAPGYPACPDHTEKAKLWSCWTSSAMPASSLTESFAMYPTAAVSGWYFAHPQARYFGVGKIDRDQVEDYARRNGMTLARGGALAVAESRLRACAVRTVHRLGRSLLRRGRARLRRTLPTCSRTGASARSRSTGPRARSNNLCSFCRARQAPPRHSTTAAQALAHEGAMVALINTRELLASLEQDGAACTFPDGDLENLSRYLQAYYRLPSYMTPILIGYAAGGTFAYAMLAQAPADLFAGARVGAVLPHLPLKRSALCRGRSCKSRRRGR